MFDPKSGVWIHNIICTGILLYTLGENDSTRSRELNTWENHGILLFEAFYGGVCELMENNVTGYHNWGNTYVAEEKYGTMFRYGFTLITDVTC